jgi:hypothetical protein
LIEYFPDRLRQKLKDQPMHVDPDFESFTYGDPTRPKAGLRRLERSDLLVFYVGLRGWDFVSEPALYIIGFFEVLKAGRVSDFHEAELQNLFALNAHMRDPNRFQRDKATLVLVKGAGNSRLFRKAVLISEMGRDRAGRPLKVLSQKMQRVFGSFDGKISIQRSPPRWVEPGFVDRAAEFLRAFE